MRDLIYLPSKEAAARARVHAGAKGGKNIRKNEESRSSMLTLASMEFSVTPASIDSVIAALRNLRLTVYKTCPFTTCGELGVYDIRLGDSLHRARNNLQYSTSVLAGHPHQIRIW